MINIDKDYLITVDLKNTKVKSDKTIFFYNTDLNICNIFIKLICTDEDKTIPEDLIVEFAVLKPETDEFKPLDATLISKEDLLYQVDLTTDYFDIVGKYSCEIRVSGTIENELKCFTSEEFDYVVKPNITAKLNKKIKNDKNLPILEKLIKDVKEMTDGINKNEIQMKRDENLVGDNKTVVGAINQLREDVNSGIGGGTVELKDYQKKNDEFLNTDEKTITGGINEVNNKIKKVQESQIELDKDDVSFNGIDDISHDELNTTNKTLIGAINEVNTQCKDIVNKTITNEERTKLSSLKNYDDSGIKNDIQTQKARMDTFTSLKEGSTTGDAELVDARIGADGVTYTNLGSNIRINQKKVKDNIKNLNYINIDKNNKSNNLLEDVGYTSGYFIHWNGTIQENKYYSYSDYIDVSEFDTCYFVSLANATTFNQHGGAMYDKNKKFIQGFKTLSADTSNITERSVEIPLNCKYVVINVANDMKNECYLKVSGKKKLDWLKVTKDNFSEELVGFVSKPWENKKVTVYGDSLTQINDWKGNKTSWISYLREYCGFSTVVNKGIGGTTIVPGTIQGKTNDFYTRITTQNDANTDLFIIFGGMNDYLFNSTIGTPDENAGTTTLCNTVKSICEYLQTNYPTAQILFILPPYGTPEPTTINTIKTINTAIENSVEMYGVSILNLYKDGDITVKNTSHKKLYYYDGVHYNDLGHERIAKNRIIPKINNLC